MVVRKSKRGDYEIEILDDIELPPELDAKAKKLIEEAEADISSTRISVQWKPEQLLVIKEAAHDRGISVADYIRQMTFERAQADLNQNR